jgi:Holliday junction DNA helicase RuvA
VISTLTGSVLELSSDSAVISVSGVGYEVRVTPRHLMTLKVSSETTIYTRLVVREDDVSLFGFSDRQEREQFDLLCSVSGIGPKLAMTVLSGMDSGTFSRAVAEQDEQAFRNIPGIGQKTAKLILLTLSGKIQAAIPVSATKVLSALKQLGTDEVLARTILAQLDSNLSESQMLKQALKMIGEMK